MNQADFRDFFSALYGQGVSPFPWQMALLEQITSTGQWPAVLDLPTSAGKTAAIEIAVFHLALQSPSEDNQPSLRTAPLRVVFVVDRRVVVDEAFHRASHLAQRLHEASNENSGILVEVARRLLRFGGDRPLHVAIMRGGTCRDDTWVRSPIQPTVCVSTVDQVGSRLLFRGYGVSEYQRPVHAALLACDSLILVDEAHLSEPFLQTLDAVRRYSGETWSEQPVMSPLRVVRMSGTTQSDQVAFRLSDADKNDSVLRRRLEARKLAQLRMVATEKDDELGNRGRWADALTQSALELAGLATSETGRPASKRGRRDQRLADTVAPVRVVGVVVNRISTARDVFSRLAELQNRGVCHVLLLTGRTRPFDRDELLYRTDVYGKPGWLRYCLAGRKEVLDRPLFVVATQTIEVGANLDFDGLVTEAAPLDALRQRFGRLDRLGSRGLSQAFILARKDAVAKNASDVIYGEALAQTWQWLSKLAGRTATVDFGLTAMEPVLANVGSSVLASLCTPRKSAPVMLPAHVEHWCQTSPTPAHEPEVALFLHGPETGPPDVQIIWRADLLTNRQGDLADTPEDVRRCAGIVALTPPTNMEAACIPFYTAREWLRGRVTDLADVEGIADAGAERERPISRHNRGRLALRWHGLDTSQLVSPDEIRPGDTLIVPASYGGLDAYGWNPDATLPVCDIADGCARLVRWRAQIRLHNSVLASWEPLRAEKIVAAVAVQAAELASDEWADDDRSRALRALLNMLGNSSAAPWWIQTAAAELLTVWPAVYRTGYPDGSGWLVRSRRRLSGDRAMAGIPGTMATAPVEEFSADDDTSSLTQPRAPVGLKEHASRVRDMVQSFSEMLGVGSCTADLTLAGLLHDAGKADPRFQILLYGGDEIAALAGDLLAKSELDWANAAAYEQARRRAELPAGFRHELLSSVLAERSGAVSLAASDVQLVQHLIGTHHGRGRPFLPAIADPTVPEIEPFDLGGCHLQLSSKDRQRRCLHRLDSGWTDSFWQLTQRYGYWGLAYLETLLRLADWHVSRCETEEGGSFV